MSTTTIPSRFATSDFNLEHLSTKQLEQHLAASISAASNVAIFGRRGTGKSHISREQIQASGYREVYMNLSLLEKNDLSGYPRLFNSIQDKVEHFISYILPVIFQPMMEGNEPVVCLLDEVDKIERELWAPLFELTHDRTINGRALPNLRCCIMTGNLIAEGGSKPPAPLLDRTEKYLVSADVSSWLDWAGRSNVIHPSIISFIKDKPTFLIGDMDQQENMADESPRGWHLSSNLVYAGEKNGWSTELINQKVCGQIGKRAGLEYRIYFASYQTLLPLVEQVFSGSTAWQDNWKGLTPSEKLYATTIICSRFASQLDQTSPANPPASMPLVGRFMQKCGYEYVIAGIKGCIQAKRMMRYSLDVQEHWKDALLDVQKSVGHQ